MTENNETKSQEAVAVFGGGCFWCTETMFQRLKGVNSVESGYSGGTTSSPSYREVCSGSTGHAEVIQICYDPSVISYEELIRVHMGSHDPTTLNAQGADVGTQYRSIIFYSTDDERQIAERVIAEMDELIDRDVVTEVKELEKFHPAEDDHRDYYNQNSEKGYCQAVIEPKLAKFRKTYQHLLASQD
ncbi:peptide-methionine (S)-S-oxide reductase MsrA [Verrucomicrobiaceae bacterium R5-34]|uniref:Peptide methionine sulfoxide reductase MsrA n=1 Tax=Oceaniferula flava TaxID=2800421 RepID=A0AAE2V7N8_9BACT|nr:peptide-methionine (S)-S-oxide reductase MsrA [Oceaniferula flavus]MBK1832043.1 peptide-methionine (S)-S-oxide reductase MsrA [Verrucomicrobiaceae bacterium R5-34]MBK1854127.1 peptide-methionine (S)-S-oxide reductase MsrA [Oceaniferula flavus]MBM1135433.1 peptide-methionine (S)-S-oxide reductase MsrA [Oceaniferula flavus]